MNDSDSSGSSTAYTCESVSTEPESPYPRRSASYGLLRDKVKLLP